MKWIINILSNYLRFATSLCVMIFMTPYIITTVGLENYGLWAVVYAIVGLIGLTDLGFATTAVKYVAEKEGEGDVDGRNQLIGNLFVIYFCIGIACLILTGITATLFELDEQFSSTTTLIWILGVATSLGLFLSVFRAILIAIGRQDLVSIASILAILLQAALTVYLLESGWNVTGLAWATGFGILAQTLLVIPLVYLVVPVFKPRFSRGWQEQASGMWSFACYALIANISVLFVLKLDPLVIQMFMPLGMIAVYAVAAKIAEQLLLFNKQLSNALMPLVSQSKGAGDTETIRRVFIDGTRYLLAIAIPMLGLVVVFADDIILLWVGEELQAAGPILQTLSVAVLFSAFTFNAANVLGMTGRHKLVAVALLSSAFGNLIISVVLIGIIGLHGVAFGTLLGIFFCEFLILVPAVCKSLLVPFTTFISRCLLPGFLTSAPSLVIAVVLDSPTNLQELIVTSGLLGSLSLAVFLAFALRDDERKYLMALVKSIRKEASACTSPIV
jgi:O-antigen/teichoic acid export membrane protein